MTDSEIRKMVLVAAAAYRGPHLGDTGLANWCRVHNLHRSAVSAFMRGRRPPAADMLDVLGLEWRLMRKKSEQPGRSANTSPQSAPL